MNTWTVPGYADIRQLGPDRVDSGESTRTVLATHVATGVPVTIRYLPGNRYRSEARLLCDVESPNVTELYEYVEGSDGAAAVREYVAGASLRRLLVSSTTLRPEAALSVLKGGLQGLAAAHAYGATHRRYTPENVLIASDGQTKLADFGVAERQCSAADDVRAALSTFALCLTGSPTTPGDAAAIDAARAKAPKRLRALLRPTATDAAELLGELDALAKAAYGNTWETQGRQRLAHHVARSLRRGRADPT